MELYQLRGFVAIAEAGNLTRAADLVHVSQPALSAQLKALEEELGVMLFDRASTGMSLTPTGRQLLAHAEKVIAEAQSLQHTARTLRGEVAGKAKVGTLSDPEFIRLGEFMGNMLSRYPLVEMELLQEVTGEALEKVRTGELDASFYYGAIPYPQIARVSLREIVYRVAAPAAWRDRIAQANWAGITAEPWIIPPEISTHHRLAHAMLDAHGVAPDKVVNADQEVVVSSLVLAGLGVALMREDVALAHQEAGRVCIWSDARAATTMWFISHGDRARDPVIRAMLDVVQGIWAPPTAPRRAEGRKPKASGGA
jgi:DNA-binding transcriptional LysR family regulator